MPSLTKYLPDTGINQFLKKNKIVIKIEVVRKKIHDLDP
jgi:hypothetical protein